MFFATDAYNGFSGGMWVTLVKSDWKVRVVWMMDLRRLGVFAVLLFISWCSVVLAQDYRYRYPYYYDYGQPYVGRDLLLQQDVTRLREDMRRQQRQIEEQTRLQEEQTRLLRQQGSTQHRVTAMQACYYRYDAGLDLCEDLFDKTSAEYAACLEKVVASNPACAPDISRAASRGSRSSSRDQTP
jgi:hypothetical protein